MIQVALNGFGRIGRVLIRLIAESPDIELVALNSTASYDDMLYLLKYDSIHGVWDVPMAIENNFLKIGNNIQARIFCDRDPSNIDFGMTGATIVLDATGKFLTTELANPYLKGNIRNVILSSPAKDPNISTYVIGVNDTEYRGESIVSNASCTTNCLAPLVKVIDDTYGVESALMTTIHSYTASQPVLDDKNPKDPRKGRAAAINMIPTTTGAAKCIGLVIPHLSGKVHWQAVRVPTPNVSLVDVNFVLKTPTDKEAVNSLFEKISRVEFLGIIEYDSDRRVSSDFCGNPASTIYIPDMTQVIGGNMLKVMAWYDNEWWYSSRLLDLTRIVANHS